MLITLKTLQQQTFKVEIDPAESVSFRAGLKSEYQRCTLRHVQDILHRSL